LQSVPARWQRSVAFLLTDQVFAAAIRRFDIADDARAGVSQALGGGLALYLSWQCTNMAGFAAGASIPASWSLEFAVPLCFGRCSHRACAPRRRCRPRLSQVP